jgi:acyl-CoA thioester hydrolase
MTFRVRFAETDQMGVAHHGAYVVWFEAGRVEWLRERGLSYRAFEDDGLSLAVSELRLRYRRAVRFDDELTLDTRLVALRSRGCAFAYTLTLSESGELVATGESDHVATDRSGRAVRIPEPWASRLAALAGDGAAPGRC